MKLKKEYWNLLTKKEKREYKEKFGDSLGKFLLGIVVGFAKAYYYFFTFIMILFLFIKDFVPNWGEIVRLVVESIYSCGESLIIILLFLGGSGYLASLIKILLVKRWLIKKGIAIRIEKYNFNKLNGGKKE